MSAVHQRQSCFQGQEREIVCKLFGGYPLTTHMPIYCSTRTKAAISQKYLGGTAKTDKTRNLDFLSVLSVPMVHCPPLHTCTALNLPPYLIERLGLKVSNEG